MSETEMKRMHDERNADTVIQWFKNIIKKCVSFLELEQISETDAEEKELKKSYEIFSGAEKQVIRRLLEEQLIVNDRMFVLSYLVMRLGIKDFWQDVAENIEREELDWISGCMLEIQADTFGEISYEKFRKVHKKNVENLYKKVNCDFEFIPLDKRNKKTIVIITEQLTHLQHAPTVMVLETAYILQEKLGYQIKVLTCTSDRKLPESFWIYTMMYSGGKKGHGIFNYKNAEIDVYQYAMRKCELEDYKEMLLKIYEWNPLFVLNMGVNNPIADLPYKFTTVVKRTMTTSLPVSEGQILIRNARSERKQETGDTIILETYQKQIFLDKKFPPVMEEFKEHYTRKELGLPEDGFLVAVVGNRLDSEIDEAFLWLMHRILSENMKINFVIIGNIKMQLSNFFEKELQSRIHCLGYCKKLLNVYRVLDLYVNPKRMGGGWSSAIALKAGLPVVTLAECDVAYNVGPQFEVSDYEEMYRTVMQYAKDEQFYKRQKEYALSLAAENGEEQSLAYVVDLMEKIKEAM